MLSTHPSYFTRTEENQCGFRSAHKLLLNESRVVRFLPPTSKPADQVVNESRGDTVLPTTSSPLVKCRCARTHAIASIPLVGKWLEVRWRYTDTDTGKYLYIWTPGRVVRVADGLNDMRTKQGKKLMPVRARCCENSRERPTPSSTRRLARSGSRCCRPSSTGRCGMAGAMTLARWLRHPLSSLKLRCRLGRRERP